MPNAKRFVRYVRQRTIHANVHGSLFFELISLTFWAAVSWIHYSIKPVCWPTYWNSRCF